MPTKPESLLTRAILKAFKAQGIFCFKVHGNMYQAAGLPDIICCVEGVFVGLEVKMAYRRNKLTELQRLAGEQIMQAGGRFKVVSSVLEATVFTDHVRESLGQN